LNEEEKGHLCKMFGEMLLRSFEKEEAERNRVKKLMSLEENEEDEE
jgi:hypothetical protein